MVHYEYEAKHMSFYELKEANGFVSMWSMYDGVNDVEEPSPYKARTMVYKNHWGEPVEATLPEGKLTWLDLWKAADKCIKESGDDHHIFIEGFRQNGGMLELVTGS